MPQTLIDQERVFDAAWRAYLQAFKTATYDECDQYAWRQLERANS